MPARFHTRYAPVRRSPPKYCYSALPLDLHVLGLSLAFILSQDQTLRCMTLFCLFFPGRRFASGGPRLPFYLASASASPRLPLLSVRHFQYFNVLALRCRFGCLSASCPKAVAKVGGFSESAIARVEFYSAGERWGGEYFSVFLWDSVGWGRVLKGVKGVGGAKSGGDGGEGVGQRDVVGRRLLVLPKAHANG